MSVNNVLGTPMTEEEYAREWGFDSLNHQKNGDYKWMSTYIPNDSIVLEIGCGSGLSTLNIVSQAKQVFSIEINDHLIKQATLYLTENGYPPKVLKLSEIINTNLSTLTERIIIINADINDPFIEQLVLKTEINFICCWLIGAAPKHASDILGVSLENLDIEYAATYRETITKKGFSLSKLKPNIGYNVVIRALPQRGVSKMELKKIVIDDLNELLLLRLPHTQIKDRKTKVESKRMQYITQGSQSQPKDMYLFSTLL
ncbi:hypothetical protein [Providencia sp. Me31A]|uniref:hypothetical protein n=1 Tax=Providencia sp. Me31A TaxID=3392637 RepID=UPI003D26CD87